MPYSEVILSCMEWSNLLAALQVVIERYGLEAVEEAVDHARKSGRVRLSGRIDVKGTL